MTRWDEWLFLILYWSLVIFALIFLVWKFEPVFIERAVEFDHIMVP